MVASKKKITLIPWKFPTHQTNEQYHQNNFIFKSKLSYPQIVHLQYDLITPEYNKF